LRPRPLSSEFFRVYLAPAGALSVDLEGGEIVIEWSLDCAGCVLEESGLVGPGSVWTPSPAQPQTINGRYRVQLPLTATQRFYRLTPPTP